MYSPIKAAQIIAFFAAKSEANTVDVLKAIKLVYLADRESIKRFGAPILDERRVSMPHGPVNSETYSHINGEHDLEKCGWSAFLEDRANHQIAVREGVKPDDLDELSVADLECLEEVWATFGAMDKWELVKWTHDPANVPEWEDPKGSSQSIPLTRMMALAGAEDAATQANLIADHERIDRLLARLA